MFAVHLKIGHPLYALCIYAMYTKDQDQNQNILETWPKFSNFSVETQTIVVSHINVNYWKTDLFWMLNKNQSYSLKIEKIMYLYYLLRC